MAEWWQRKLPRPLRWYRIPRSYRVVDEVYVLATSAREAVSQHWEGYGGTGYGFGDDALTWATAASDVGDIRMSRTRRVDVMDVPAWMVNAAVQLKAYTPSPEAATAVEAWNHSAGAPEDSALAYFVRPRGQG